MILYTIIHVFVIVGILYLYRPKNELKAFYWSGILFKISCGLLLGWIYMNYLGLGDTVVFHQAAMQLYKLPFEEYLDKIFTAQYPVFKGEGRNEFFTKILSGFYWLTGGNYWLSSTYLSTISFASSWYFVTRIRTCCPKLWLPAAISFLFLPTAAFWTSGVMKDTLIGAALFFLFAQALDYHHACSVKKRHISLSTIALLVLFYLKFYLIALTGFCLGYLAWWQLINQFNLKKETIWLLTFLVAFCLAFGVSYLNMNLHWDKLPTAIHTNYLALLERSQDSMTINFPHLKPTWMSLLAHIPLGLLAGLTRPWLWESNLFMIIPALEHLIIVVLGLYNVIRLTRINHILIYLGLFFCLTLASLLPLTTPNFGTLIRYEAVYLPLLLFILSIRPFKHFFSKT